MPSNWSTFTMPTTNFAESICSQTRRRTEDWISSNFWVTPKSISKIFINPSFFRKYFKDFCTIKQKGKQNGLQSEQVTKLIFYTNRYINELSIFVRMINTIVLCRGADVEDLQVAFEENAGLLLEEETQLTPRLGFILKVHIYHKYHNTLTLYYKIAVLFLPAAVGLQVY